MSAKHNFNDSTGHIYQISNTPGTEAKHKVTCRQHEQIVPAFACTVYMLKYYFFSCDSGFLCRGYNPEAGQL